MLEVQVGVFYIFDIENDILCLFSVYVMQWCKQFVNEFCLGEFLVGQSVLEKKIIIFEQVFEEYMLVGFGMGNVVLCNVMVLLIFYDDELKGVLEVGVF